MPTRITETSRHRTLNESDEEFERRDAKNQHAKQRRDTWHLDKTVSISHITATISIVIMLGIGASKMDTRLTVVENGLISNRAAFLYNDDNLRKEAERQDSAIQQQLSDIKTSLARIETAISNKADKDLVQALVDRLK